MNIFRSLTVGGWEGVTGPLDQRGKRTSPNSERKEAVGVLATGNIRRSSMNERTLVLWQPLIPIQINQLIFFIG